MLRRFLLSLVLRLDRLHLRWGLHEIDQGHPDVGAILSRVAIIDHRLQRLRCRCHYDD